MRSKPRNLQHQPPNIEIKTYSKTTSFNNMSTPIVFICGATGTQGGSVARVLRSKDIEVHATVRDPTSNKAKDLETLGVKLWPGDYDNIEALEAAMKDCTGAFLNFMPDFKDQDAEKRHATNILTTAKKAGVKHVTYSGGLAPGAEKKITHWEPESLMAKFMNGKTEIEQQCQNAGFQSWTILRPGNFMANFLTPLVRMYHPFTETGVWVTVLKPETLLPMTATVTIGEFGAATFLNPERFGGQAVGFADELLRPDDVLEKLSKAAGRELRAEYLSDEEAEKLKVGNPFIGGQLAMRDLAKFFDMEEIKGWGVPLSSFDEFIAAEQKRIDETYQKST